MKRSSASRRQVAGRVDHYCPVGDGAVMAYGLCWGGSERESGVREVARFVRGISNIAFHDKRREINGKEDLLGHNKQSYDNSTQACA